MHCIYVHTKTARNGIPSGHSNIEVGLADLAARAGLGSYAAIKRLGVADQIMTLKTLPPITHHMCFNREFFASQTQFTEKDLPGVILKMANDTALKKNTEAIIGMAGVISISERESPL